jgi:hypothetical protein
VASDGGDLRQVDAPAFFRGGDVRRNRGAETVGIDQRSVPAASTTPRAGARRPRCGPVASKPAATGFIATALTPLRRQGVQQRAGDESLADFGIGAGDEPAAWVCSFSGVGKNHVVTGGQPGRCAVRFVGRLHPLPGRAPEQAAACALADRVGADVLDRAQQ